MPEITHDIDLSAIPHRPGQSQDLEAKRQRAWERLTDEERTWVLDAWELTGMIPSAPAFREMQSASDRVLYVLVGTEESLTPLELCYLMIARWFRNIDPATARAKMAQLVNQGFARYTGVGRTMATEAGLERLEELAQRRRTRDDDDPDERRSDHRTTTSRSRVVDRGESARSSFGNRAAPTGRYRSEIPDDGGRPGRRDDRREDSEERSGRDWSSRSDYRGRDSFNSRGEPRVKREPRRESRDSDRGDRRDDSRGSRGPRRDDRRSSGDERRGGFRGGRDSGRGTGGDSPRRRERNDRGGSPERGRVNRDGPVIDGRDRRAPERRVNTDGPVIDGRDRDKKSDDDE